jgi:hypothetical protein
VNTKRPLFEEFLVTTAMSRFAAVTWLVALAGCSGEKAPPSGTVSGRLTLDGRPLSAVTLQFRDPTKGILALSAQDTGPNGEYHLKVGIGPQVPVGEYVVSILPDVDEAALLASEAGATPERIAEAQRKSSASTTKKVDVPGRYLSEQTSGLKATVVEGANTFDFDLKSR